MKYTKIYVGSNNETGILEITKIKEILRNGQCGYTLTTGRGYWKGNYEDVAIIEIYGDYNLAIISEFRKQLNQKSILVSESITESKFHE